MQVSPATAREPSLRSLGANRTTVPPPWFLSTVTAYSAHQPQAYCSLIPAMGFTAFPPPVNPALDESSAWSHREASPQRGSYPSTNSPRQQPYRIAAAFALLRLPLVPSPLSHACRSMRLNASPPPPTEACERRTPGRSQTYMARTSRYSHPTSRRSVGRATAWATPTSESRSERRITRKKPIPQTERTRPTRHPKMTHANPAAEAPKSCPDAESPNPASPEIPRNPVYNPISQSIARRRNAARRHCRLKPPACLCV
jgi:hypothetical protein